MGLSPKSVGILTGTVGAGTTAPVPASAPQRTVPATSSWQHPVVAQGPAGSTLAHSVNIHSIKVSVQSKKQVFGSEMRDLQRDP